jgi:hypothetical protein
MSAAFRPERLGKSTTVSLTFNIVTPTTDAALLSSLNLRYPANLGFATSGLGVAACLPSTLETLGSAGCPPDSRMGKGSALVQIPIGPELVKETAEIALFAGPSQNGYLQILIYATGRTPVIANVLLTTQLEPQRLDIAIPPIPSLPEAPYVSLVEMHLTLGGALTYYERVHGRNVAYHPAGIGLPRRCPRGGFPFAARFGFLDGGHTSARTRVACPRR